MTLEEMLKAQGLNEEQIKKIVKLGVTLPVEGGKKVEDLEKEIEDYKDDLKKVKADADLKVRNLVIDYEIDGFLKENKAKYPDLLASKFDREKVIVDETGKTTNVGELGKGIMESYKELFSESVSGFTPENPDKGTNENGSYDHLVNNADNMTADEVAAQFANMKFE